MKFISCLLLLACILYTITQIETTCGCGQPNCSCNTIRPAPLNIEGRKFHPDGSVPTSFVKEKYTGNHEEFHLNYQSQPNEHIIYKEPQQKTNNHFNRADAISLGLAYQAMNEDRRSIPEFQIHHGTVQVHFKPKHFNSRPAVHEENLWQLKKEIIGLKKRPVHKIEHHTDCLEDIEERKDDLAHKKEIGDLPTYDNLGYKLDNFENAHFDDVVHTEPKPRHQIQSTQNYHDKHNYHSKPQIPQHLNFNHDYEHVEIIPNRKPTGCGCQGPVKYHH